VLAKRLALGPRYATALAYTETFTEIADGWTCTLDLTTTEFRLLAALARFPGRVYSRAQLLDAVQGIDYEGYERTIDAHIKNLRQKMAAGEADCGCRIVTVRGVGYKLEVAADAL